MSTQDVRAPSGIDPRLEKKFWDSITVNLITGCWEWDTWGGNHGYGLLQLDRVRYLAHRVSYEIHKGIIPDGIQVDHLCRNRLCVNPRHLELVTMQENIRRGNGPSALNSRKGECPKGHPYSGDNLRLGKDGSRKCKICERDNGRRANQQYVEKYGMSKSWYWKKHKLNKAKEKDDVNV